MSVSGCQQTRTEPTEERDEVAPKYLFSPSEVLVDDDEEIDDDGHTAC